MKIIIEIEESSKDGKLYFRPHLTVDYVEVYLGTCRVQYDAIRDSLTFLQKELERGNYSKFASFHTL